MYYVRIFSQVRPKVAAAAIEQEIAGALPGRPKVLLDCLARLLGDLEADRKTGLALPNGRAFDGMEMWVDVLDLQAHQVAATRLAHPYRSVTTFPPKSCAAWRGRRAMAEWRAGFSAWPTCSTG